MDKILNWVKKQWMFLTRIGYFTSRTELTPEEFRKEWNDNLEAMKIK